MKSRIIHPMIFRNTALQLVVFISTVVFLGNLNAIVDHFLHPAIPYFDQEHLIVGGITGLVSAILFGLVILYARQLEQTLSEIKVLESFLPICSNCKKIRIIDADADQQESWQSIDAYITQHTSTSFSHGICPECKRKLYPEFESDEGI